MSKFGVCDYLLRWFFGGQRDLDPTPSDTTTMSEGVINRRMTFCDRLLSTYATHELYETCDHCDQFFCICCLHSSGNKSCHHYPVVFTDGACSGNGFGGAVSGIGGSYGENAEHRWSILVDDRIDPNAVRTNQRAELLAAIEGVRRLGDLLLSSSSNEPARKGPRTEMVVATDSEYVCKGVTEWMPKWKVFVQFSSTFVCTADSCEDQWMAEQLEKNCIK